MNDQLPLMQSNVPDFSVSELAFSLKRTIEDNYGRVRVRGELSRISIPKSGHLYTNLKDDKSVIDAVCWKGVLTKLSIKPEEGLEVICTGRITTYPARSNYQLVIEEMELAGEGALLKMLEERKKKLAAEGLFAPERKQKLPFLPERIGVVTSPTGSVIRDILHRLEDRFPRHVMVWPVKVQGEGAADEIAKAINGFHNLPEKQRPDLIIIARGGGSLEDLMPFNEENVVRAAANCDIPIISAVGHETDTTLIDYAADLRAPTPTGAAEKAVPVRLELQAHINENEGRLINTVNRMVSEKRHKLEAYHAKLGDPKRLLEYKIQYLDQTAERLDRAIEKQITHKQHKAETLGTQLRNPAQLIETKAKFLEQISTRTQNAYNQYLMTKNYSLKQNSSALRPPKQLISNGLKDLTQRTEALTKASKHFLEKHQNKVTQTAEKLELLSFENVLQRGYVVVRDAHDNPISSPSSLKYGDKAQLQFKDNKRININIEKSSTQKQSQQTNRPSNTQDSLF